MRTLRVSLIGTVVVMLLAGLAGTAVARTDGSARVTGSELYSMAGSYPEFSEDGVLGEDWIGHGRGMGSTQKIEWSDPRLPSEVQSVTNFEAYGSEVDGDVGAVVINSMWLLEDSDGTWIGPWTGWCDDQDRCQGMVVLTGHGAYDGFYTVLTERLEEDADGTATKVFEGAILAGEMPPLPAPPEPTTK